MQSDPTGIISHLIRVSIKLSIQSQNVHSWTYYKALNGKYARYSFTSFKNGQYLFSLLGHSKDLRRDSRIHRYFWCIHASTSYVQFCRRGGCGCHRSSFNYSFNYVNKTCAESYRAHSISIFSFVTNQVRLGNIPKCWIHFFYATIVHIRHIERNCTHKTKILKNGSK